MGLLVFCEFAMTRSLIIFGNGLGMALDPDHFSLSNAMARLWQSEKLTAAEKAIFGQLRGINPDTGPTSEQDLISAQLALELLSDFKELLGDEARANWFRADAIEFPNTIRKYVYWISADLFNYKIPQEKQATWEKFTRSLIPYIMDSKTHIATLNYDDLIYGKIVDGIFANGHHYRPTERQQNSTSPYVRDGFNKGDFRPEMFSFSGTTGFYLHLHGTPLFVKKQKGDGKLERKDLESSDPIRERYIVLASPNDKMKLIEQSNILKNFWNQQLPRCLREADQIIVFGYSGFDDHLNDKIKASEKPTYVVEWVGARGDTAEATYFFWKEKLGEVKKVIRADSILDFDCWDRPGDFIPF